MECQAFYHAHPLILLGDAWDGMRRLEACSVVQGICKDHTFAPLVTLLSTSTTVDHVQNALYWIRYGSVTMDLSIYALQL